MRIVQIVRWTTRIISSGILLLFLLIALGEGFPPMRTLPVIDQMSFLSLLGICTGCLIGWRWETAAGILILSCFLSFSLLQQVFLFNLLFVSVIGVGISYLTLGLIRNRHG